MNGPAAEVEAVRDLEYAVTWQGQPMPRMLPGRVMLFGQDAAGEYAAALDADDTAACHRIIAASGQVYAVAS